mgnify:CR=1 FL=1
MECGIPVECRQGGLCDMQVAHLCQVLQCLHIVSYPHIVEAALNQLAPGALFLASSLAFFWQSARVGALLVQIGGLERGAS